MFLQVSCMEQWRWSSVEKLPLSVKKHNVTQNLNSNWRYVFSLCTSFVLYLKITTIVFLSPSQPFLGSSCNVNQISGKIRMGEDVLATVDGHWVRISFEICALLQNTSFQVYRKMWTGSLTSVLLSSKKQNYWFYYEYSSFAAIVSHGLKQSYCV